MNDLFRELSRNEKKILKYIFYNKIVSRPKFLDIMDIKPATLYRAIEKLQQLEYIKITKNEYITGIGRPCDTISINENFCYFCSIDVRRFSYTVAILDFAFNVVAKKELQCNQNTTPKALLIDVYSIYENMLNNKFIKSEKIVFVALSSFGVPIYNCASNNLHRPLYPGFSWEDYNIIEEFRCQFGKKVYFDYGARTAAFGSYSENKAIGSFAYILLDEGVGIGAVCDDEYIGYSDTKFVNGLGHMVIDLYGEKCRCGNHGCLETICSEPAMVRNAKRQIKLGRNTKLRNLANINIEKLCLLAQDDEIAKNIVSEAAHAFSIALLNYLNIIQIDTVVLGGTISKKSELFYSIVREKIKKKQSSVLISRDTSDVPISLKGIVAYYIVSMLQ